MAIGPIVSLPFWQWFLQGNPLGNLKNKDLILWIETAQSNWRSIYLNMCVHSFIFDESIVQQIGLTQEERVKFLAAQNEYGPIVYGNEEQKKILIQKFYQIQHLGSTYNFKKHIEQVALSLIAWIKQQEAHTHKSAIATVQDRERQKNENQKLLNLLIHFLCEVQNCNVEDLYRYHQRNLKEVTPVVEREKEDFSQAPLETFTLLNESEKKNHLEQDSLHLLEFALEERKSFSWHANLLFIEKGIDTDNCLNQNDEWSTPCMIHRLLFYAGELHGVFEKISTGELQMQGLKHVDQVKILADDDSHSKREGVEIENFVKEWLSWEEQQLTRIILKVTSPGLKLNPYYHFLHNPFEAINGKGERIWAASVEVCPDLFDWLSDLGEAITIIDPSEVKELFDEYQALKRQDFSEEVEQTHLSSAVDILAKIKKAS